MRESEGTMASPNLQQTFNLMQNFMLKKGLIDKSMTEEELSQFLTTAEIEKSPEAIAISTEVEKN